MLSLGCSKSFSWPMQKGNFLQDFNIPPFFVLFLSSHSLIVNIIIFIARTRAYAQVDPMRFFYQIFVVNPSIGHETVLSSKEVKTSSSNNNNNSPLFNVNNNDNSNNNHNKKYQNNQQQQQYKNNNSNNIQATSNSNVSLNGSNAKRPNEANNKTSNFSSIASSSSSGLINKPHDTKSVRFASVKPKTSNKSVAYKGKHSNDEAKCDDAPVDADSCYSFSDEKPLKVAFVSSKNAKGSKTYNILPASGGSNGNVSPSTSSASKPDFKSLRSNVSHNVCGSAASNDSTYHNDSSKFNNSGTVTENDPKQNSAKVTKTEHNAFTSKSAMKHGGGGGGDAKQKNKTASNDGKNNRNGNTIQNSPNIVVSIPQHRRVSFSDDVFDNMSLAELKTANKKSKNGSSPRSDRYDDDEKKELPKLKIALSNLKAKITSPKHKEKSRKEPETNQSNDTVLDYVGLKPVSQSSDNSRSPKSDDSTDHGHKKRKKSGKHSKEPKRRKLHAEISSQEEESLKLKVKITGGKPSKHERKSSVTSSDENSSSSSTTAGSDAKEIESPIIEAISASPGRTAAEAQPCKPTAPPPNASPARVQEDDVVFVSSTKSPNTKTVKFAPWKEPKANTQRASPVSSAASSVKPTFAVPVGKPKVAKPQSMVDFRSRGVFSPPHVPNYPTFHLPPPKLISASPHLSPLKRSSSVDSRPEQPKMPKLDVPARKNTIPNLIKATPPMKNSAIANKSMKPNELFYNSSLSSKYTREVHTTKPLPMLLPQGSVTVSEISNTDSQAYASGASGSRPALEIVRIPANVPTVDQHHKQQLQLQAASLGQKANRPMPSTIPLMKIKNASNQIKLNARDSEGNAVLDLSGRNSRSPSHSPSPPTIANRQLNTYSSASLPRLVTVSAPNSSQSQSMTIKSAPMSIAVSNSLTRTVNANMSRVMPKNAIPSSIASANNNKNSSVRNGNGMQATQRDKLPPPLFPVGSAMSSARHLQMPKLNEIGKSRPNGPVRQQNASVRNIPNPSALAFRNQGVQQKAPRERSSPPTAVSVASATGFTTASPKAQSPTLPAGNRTPTYTSASVDISVKNRSDAVTITPMLRNMDPATATALLLSTLAPISKQLKAPTLSKQNFNTDMNSSGGRNNNNEIIDAKLIAAKKNQHIERVAATLRAAAANEASAPQRLSMSPVSKSTGTSISS